MVPKTEKNIKTRRTEIYEVVPIKEERKVKGLGQNNKD